jgi:hypothetical protein
LVDTGVSLGLDAAALRADLLGAIAALLGGGA